MQLMVRRDIEQWILRMNWSVGNIIGQLGTQLPVVSWEQCGKSWIIYVWVHCGIFLSSHCQYTEDCSASLTSTPQVGNLVVVSIRQSSSGLGKSNAQAITHKSGPWQQGRLGRLEVNGSSLRPWTSSRLGQV
jgi:hypothetical protein